MPEPTVVPGLPEVSAKGRGVWASLRRQWSFWLCVCILAVLSVIALAPELFAMFSARPDPRVCILGDSAQPPSSTHPFGTDLQGCDVLANVIHGTRTSLLIGLLATTACLIVALIVGTLAGYYGGMLDRVVSRLTDVFLGFPFLLGAIIVLNSVHRPGPITVAFVLALFSWPTMSRLVRGAVRAVKQQDFIAAARATGSSDVRILLRHVVPNALGPVLAIAATMVGTAIVAEATLTFLGVGLRSPSISWGLQLANAQAHFGNSPHMLVFPALFLTITVLALISLGDILRDALDPKGRGR